MTKSDDRKALTYRVCELFFKEEKKVSEIAELINREFRQDLTRESIYPLLATGRQHGFVRLVPPLDEQMPRLLAEKFHHDPKLMKVVDLCDTPAVDAVAVQAAEVVLSLVKRLLRNGRKPVALGLGPGRATLEVCRHLAEIMRSDPDVPNGCLRLHAITGGGPAKHPEFAPISFFNLFPTRFVAECDGLFSETLVTVRDFNRLIKRADISQAFKQRDSIDVVVTSRGAVERRSRSVHPAPHRRGNTLGGPEGQGMAGQRAVSPLHGPGAGGRGAERPAGGDALRVVRFRGNGAAKRQVRGPDRKELQHLPQPPSGGLTTASGGARTQSLESPRDGRVGGPGDLEREHGPARGGGDPCVRPANPDGLVPADNPGVQLPRQNLRSVLRNCKHKLWNMIVLMALLGLTVALQS